MVSIENLMFESAEEVLATIGEPIRQALLMQLKQDGIAFSTERVDLARLESKLSEFFGVGSPVIIEKIYDSFITKAIESGFISPDTFRRLDVDSNSIIAVRQCNEEQTQESS